MGRRASGLSPKRGNRAAAAAAAMPQGGEARCGTQSTADRNPRRQVDQNVRLREARPLAPLRRDRRATREPSEPTHRRRMSRATSVEVRRDGRNRAFPGRGLSPSTAKARCSMGTGRAGRHELLCARMHHQLPSWCAQLTAVRGANCTCACAAPRRSAARRHDHEQRQANEAGRLRGQAGCSRGHGTRLRLPPQAAAAPPPRNLAQAAFGTYRTRIAVCPMENALGFSGLPMPPAA